MDLGSTIANMAKGPVRHPECWEGLVRAFINPLAGIYYRDYRRLRVLDDTTVRYYQVFRAKSQLIRVGEAILNERANLGIYGSTAEI